MIHMYFIRVLTYNSIQFRMHNAQGVDVIYNVSSRPIIEDSSNIRVTEYPAISVEVEIYDTYALSITCLTFY